MEKINQSYKSNLLGLMAKPIPYNKELNQITGNVLASILWQQLEYWFNKKNGNSFYKFLMPLEKEKIG